MQTRRLIRSIRWLLLAVVMLFIPPVSFAQGVGISITVAPPALPVYVQPVCPSDNYIWTPGYWAYSDDDEDYYWVPGTWVLAPTPGYLWTPGYWGWNNGVYAWNDGYWGPHIGFYGGVNYGYGYGGEGYEGGYWRGDNFFYNRTVNNVNVTEIHNVYNKTVVNNYTSVNRASFNGPGGVSRRPTPQEETYVHEQHTRATAAQTEHQHAAASDRSQFASVNHGKPAVAATAKPGNFKGAGVVPARAAAPYKGATGKGTANARGAKTDGASTAANRTSAPARTTTPPAHNTEHTNAGATSEHKNASAGAKPPAHENTARRESTQGQPHTTTARALQKRSQSTRLLQNRSQSTRLLQNRSHNTKLLQNRSHNTKLLQNRSHNTKLLQNRSHNTKLLQNRSHNTKLLQNRSHNTKLLQNRSHNTKLLQNRSHNTKLLRNRSHNMKLRRNRRANLRKNRSNKKGWRKQTVSCCAPLRQSSSIAGDHVARTGCA